MHMTVWKLIWFVAAFGIAYGVNAWRHDSVARGLEAAREGDRDAAEGWVDRALSDSRCELHEAGAYLGSASRQYVRRPD